jgi:hypothetical protein
MTLPVLPQDDYGAFCRKCFFEPERLGSFAKAVEFGPNGLGMENSGPVSRETDEIYRTGLLMVQRQSVGPLGVEAEISVFTKNLTAPPDAFYDVMMRELMLPAVICQSWLRQVTTLRMASTSIIESELRNLYNYRFYGKYFKSLQSRGNQARVSALKPFRPSATILTDVRLPGGIPFLDPALQKPILSRTLEEIADLSAETLQVVSGIQSTMDRAIRTDTAGKLTIDRILRDMDTISNEDNPLIDRFVAAKQEIKNSVDQYTQGLNSKTKPITSITVTNRSAPKFRHLAIIGAICTFGSLFFTIVWHFLSIEARRTREG